MSNKVPELSIIIPVYNTEDYLRQCLDSLDCQGDIEYEVILVDDGSNDNSGKICDEYCLMHDHALVVHKHNEGLLAARRDGLAHAHGRYVLPLDSDDCLLPGCLKKVIAAIGESNSDIVSFDYTTSLVSCESSMKARITRGVHRDTEFLKVCEELCKCNFNSVWNKAVRRELVPGYDWYSNRVGLMHGEDLSQLLPIFDASSSLYHIAEPLYYYRQHASNSTRTFKFKQIEDWNTVSDELLEYASKWSKNALENAQLGICLHYCNLEELLWDSNLSNAQKEEMDIEIRLEYHSRIKSHPELVHDAALSDNSFIAHAARALLHMHRKFGNIRTPVS